jgi:PAS domain S-box-containing protein
MGSQNRHINKKWREARQLFLARTRRERTILQTLIDSIPDEVWFCDAEANLTLANKAAFEGLGLEHAEDVYEAMGKWLPKLEIYTADGRPRPHEYAPLLRALEGKILRDVHEVVRHPVNGKMLHRLVSSAPIMADDGAIVGALAVVHDVTEQRHMEDARRRIEMLLNRTQSLTKVGGWELDVATGQVIWTDEVYRIYGVEPDAYDPSDVSRDMSFFAPQAQSVLKRAFQRALDHGEPYDLELGFNRTDGRHIWVRTVGIPETRGGQVLRISGNIMDITERKRAELDLVAYKNIVSSTNDIISLVDKNYQYRVVNDVYLKLHDKTREQIIGHHVIDLLGRKVFDEVIKQNFDRCFAGETVKFTLWFDYPGEGRRLLAVTYFPYVENGRITGAIVNGKDITDLQLVQEQLEKAYNDLSAREQIARLFLLADEDHVYGEVTDLLLKVFGCKWGFIAHLNEAGDLVCPSFSGDIRERRPIPEKSMVFPQSCWAGSWGRSLQEKRSMKANQALALPNGHIALSNALAAPILLEDELIGQLLLANKDRGFTDGDRVQLERIATFIAPILKERLEKEKYQKDLKDAAQQLERRNIALSVLLDNREREKKRLADDLVANVEQLVLPYFDEARKSRKLDDLTTLVEIIERNIRESIRSLDKPAARLYRRLTSMEIQVADLIKSGKTSKEIAGALNISLRSVYFHRNNIRRKLGIHNRKANLKSHLISFR